MPDRRRNAGPPDELSDKSPRAGGEGDPDFVEEGDEQSRAGLVKSERISPKKAKTAAQRAEHAQEQLVFMLSAQLELHQSECSSARCELARLRPRVAELEQASRNARQNSMQSTFAGALGSVLIATAAMMPETVGFTMAGFGGASVLWAAVLMLVTNRKGWPSGTPESKTQAPASFPSETVHGGFLWKS